MATKRVLSVAVARRRLDAAHKKAKKAATAFNKANAVYIKAKAASRRADTKCRQRERAQARQCAVRR